MLTPINNLNNKTSLIMLIKIQIFSKLKKSENASVEGNVNQ